MYFWYCLQQSLGDTSVGVTWQYPEQRSVYRIRSLTGVSGIRRGACNPRTQEKGQEALPCRGLASHWPWCGTASCVSESATGRQRNSHHLSSCHLTLKRPTVQAGETQVWSPAPTSGGWQTPITLASGDPWSFPGLCSHPHSRAYFLFV